MKTYGRKLNNACKCELCFNRTFEKDSKTRERNLAKEEIKEETEAASQGMFDFDICCVNCCCPPDHCEAESEAYEWKLEELITATKIQK